MKESATKITCDVTVVGGGVVGLAIARKAALSGLKVVLVEQGRAMGHGISGRNSGVVHAGIYYKPGSLKALLSVAGNKLLYDFADERAIPHRRCGKFVVATSENELAALHDIFENARESGVTDMQLIDGKEAAWLEPKLSCIAALHLPQSGVISVKHYVTALVGDLEAAGGEVLRSCVFQSAKASPNMVDIDIQGASQTKISCAYLVNAAGLQAHAVAGKIDGLDPILIPRIYYAKGNYFRILAPAPFERLIYPIPIPGGSGLHYGWDGAGQAD